MEIPFIYTCSPSVSKNSEIYQESIFYHAKTCLVSLIHALPPSRIDWNSARVGSNEIRKFKQRYLKNNETFFLDSGGFSIISGNVHSQDITKFIDCYVKSLDFLKDDIDYVFQLDIPIFLNQPDQCTKSNIYNFNKESISNSIDIIKENPQLIDKFLAVLQFKIKSQFDIWEQLYNEMELYKYHKYYSVGGLVSLYGICPHINFAPFIGPVYYWLYYYHLHSNFKYPFFIHILGTYHKFTRFIIRFFIKLINRYLKPYCQRGFVTYDSVNYTLSALYKARVGLEYYKIENGNLKVYHSHDLSNEILKEIYQTDNCLNSYLDNVKRIDNNDKLTDTTFLVPLNISSQLNLDQFFDDLIDKHGLVDIFLTANCYNSFKNKSAPIINSLSFYPTLTNNLVGQIEKSLRIIYIFDQWYRNDRGNKLKLMTLMNNFITKINFPFDLI
jgi:hypothetical protein